MPSQATPVSPKQRPGEEGRGGRIPSGLTQSPLMEPGVERARTQQHNLEMPLELLGARGLMLQLLVFSSVIWRLMLMDKTVLSERLLVDLSLSDGLFQRYLASFLYFQYFLIPNCVISTLFWPIRPHRYLQPIRERICCFLTLISSYLPLIASVLQGSFTKSHRALTRVN